MSGSASSEHATILVTGASGLFGRAVVARLAAEGRSVRGADRLPAPEGLKSADAEFRIADLRDIDQAFALAEDVQAIVHLAAWPTPFTTDPKTVWSDNVAMTANLVAAARREGLDKFIYASSQSVLGLAWSKTVTAPDYLPVDEEHACRPVDPYSMSKLAGERLTEMLAQVSKLSTMALRFPVIWDRGEFDKAVANRIDNPQQGAKSQWAYVDARDAAHAVALALDSKVTGYQCLNIASRCAFLPEGDVVSAVRRWYPGLEWSGPEPARDAAVYSSRKARDLLGFESRYIWRPDGIHETHEAPTRSDRRGG